MNLSPLPGHALVELRERYEHVATTEQKYETHTSGICLDILYQRKDGDNIHPEDIKRYFLLLQGKRVFWEEYKDGATIERDGKKYAFIKIEDLTGYEDVETE